MVKKATVLETLIPILMTFLITFTGLAGLASADSELLLTLSPDELNINTTETREVKITITNNLDVSDSFSISVWPSTKWAGITPNLEKYKTKTLAPGANDTVKLYLTVDSGADEIITTFLVSAHSILYPNISASEDVDIRIVRKTEIYVSDLALDRYLLNSGECLTITTTISNFGSDAGPYRLKTYIREGSVTIESFDDYIEIVRAMSTKSVENTYCFDKYATATSYSVETILKTALNKFVDSSITNFRIKGESNLVYGKTVAYTPFAKIKAIKVKNEGNIVEHGFYVTETVSDFVSKFFYPEVEPDETITTEGKVTYKWFIDSLWPGEENEIKYEIRFFSIWFSGLILIIVVFFAFTYVYRPRIRKNVKLVGPIKKGKEISVLLEIRNSTINEIKNVIVKDSVPSIAQLVQRFDTIKPDTSKSDSGIELTWKIKSLQPLEERVLTYRIKPSVDIIGSMRLPSATISYTTKKKERKAISSRSLEIK